MPFTTAPNAQSCLDACNRCHQMCLQGAMTHCLETGGEHVAPEHMRLMLNCAEICQTAANFMLSHSAFSSQVCKVCAEICDACAQDCERVGDMEECVQSCRACAEECRRMASFSTH